MSGEAAIRCFPSKPRLLGLFGLTCMMVGMSYLVTLTSDFMARVVGWIGVAFFGLGFIVFPLQFFRKDPQVVINDEGIEDRRQKIGVIRWEDIRSLSVGSIQSTSFLCVDLIEPEKYLSRMPKWARPLRTLNEKLGFPAISIGFQGLRPGLAEVWDHLQARFDASSRTIRRAPPPQA